MSGSRAVARGQGYVRVWPQRAQTVQAPGRGWGSTVFFPDAIQVLPTAATNLACASNSQASVGPLYPLCPNQELRQSLRVMGTGDNHFMATGRGHDEAWSSCPAPLQLSWQETEQDWEERGCQPAHSAPPPHWVGPVAPSLQPSYALGCLVSSGPGHGGGHSLDRFRPGHQGPQRSAAPANSKSCCIQGWPDLRWGHGPQVGTGAQPPHRAARMWICGSSWAPG